MRRSDYEWVNYIGGNCGLIHRKTRVVDARIDHIEQGWYEAQIVRRDETTFNRQVTGYVSLGIFNNPEEAEAIIEKVLEDVWEK